MTSRRSLEELQALVSQTSEREEAPAASEGSLDAGARAALHQAFRLLSIRGYAKAELRRRLSRQHESTAVDSAVAFLEAKGFLDDAAWAAAFVGGLRGRQRSSALLRRDLAVRGVKGDEASAALEGHDDEVAALTVARRRVASLRGLEPEVRERRLRNYLLRRGFSGALAQRVTSETLARADDA